MRICYIACVIFLLFALSSLAGESQDVGGDQDQLTGTRENHRHLADKTYCVAKIGLSLQQLQKNTRVACQHPRVNCSPIRFNNTCFEPNTHVFHASYVMNSYYRVTGNCNFDGTGRLMQGNPNVKRCKFL